MVTISEQFEKQITKRARVLWPDLGDAIPVVKISRTTERRHGDYATSIALQLAPLLKRPAMEIAEAIVRQKFPMACLRDAFVAPPGFINFTLDPAWLLKQPKQILAAGQKFGRNDLGKNQRVHLEFISANPTGPLHLGNGRGGFNGDVIGNVLAFSGYRVHREYYVNDKGKQVDTLAESVVRRYFQSKGIPVDYPDTCYQGAYITELAHTLKLDQLNLGNLERAKTQIRDRALRAMLTNVKRTIRQALHIRFDRYFLESELYKKKIVDRMLRRLREQKLVYEKDGALWLKTSTFGDEKDRVVVKADGEQTYFLSDVAYLWEKFAVRRFDQAIILLGADHHGYVDRMQSVVKALGWPDRLTVKLFQLVRLMDHGQEVRMSKRSGTFITLDELVNDVGLDVARFFFLMMSASTHMDFDLALAKEHSDKNPVFYVQYAHARICSILRNTRPLLKKGQIAKIPLTDQSASSLIRKLLEFPEVVLDAAQTLNVHELPVYSLQLATAFHEFYTRVRIIDQGSVNRAALELTQATQQVLQQTLGLLGISAPEKM